MIKRVRTSLPAPVHLTWFQDIIIYLLYIKAKKCDDPEMSRLIAFLLVAWHHDSVFHYNISYFGICSGNDFKNIVKGIFEDIQVIQIRFKWLDIYEGIIRRNTYFYSDYLLNVTKYSRCVIYNVSRPTIIYLH